MNFQFHIISNVTIFTFCALQFPLFIFSGNVQKKKSIFKDIIQIMVDHPPSYPIFDKFWLGGAPTLPTEFLTKDSKENSILSIFIHEISHNMIKVHKISENICKKAFITLKFIKNK